MKQRCAKIGKFSVVVFMGIACMWLILSFAEVNSKNLHPSKPSVSGYNAFRIVSEVAV